MSRREPIPFFLTSRASSPPAIIINRFFFFFRATSGRAMSIVEEVDVNPAGLTIVLSGLFSTAR